MIRPIMTNEFFLSQPSEPATAHDVEVGKNLVDTLSAHAHECVGMAANMIGVRKRVIVFADGAAKRVMFNPEIVGASGEYEAMEGCLSLEGQRKAKRYKRITVCIATIRLLCIAKRSWDLRRRSFSMKSITAMGCLSNRRIEHQAKKERAPKFGTCSSAFMRVNLTDEPG